MRWEQMLYEASELRMREGGRPLGRLARGLVWTFLAIFIISLLAFLLGLAPAPPPIIG